MQWNDFLPHIAYLPPEDLQRIRKAFDVCIAAHEGQKRKSGEPFATHPIAVAQILAKLGADAETLIAALLHDVVEDTAVTLDTLTQEFGPSIGGLIEAITKLDDEEIRAHPTLDEETESLRKMITMMEKDVRLMIIKLADRLHNMQTIASLPSERRKTYAQETLEIYAKIADRLSMQDLRDDLEAQCLVILEPALFPKMKSLRDVNAQEGARAAQQMEQALRSSVLALPSALEIRCESKTWHHLRERIEREQIQNMRRPMITIAFICDTTISCYQILGALHSLWRYRVLTFKDFINTPAINGYRGLHTTVTLDNGAQVRCKIRTREMHAYAHKGIASLCFDHQQLGLLEYLPWLERIIPLSQDTAQRSAEFLENLQSDILGRSITIYGVDGRSVQLPHDATALDGAFFLYGERALCMNDILINGNSVPFFSTLAHSATLSIQDQGERTVRREWLEWARTGLATAKIREALGEISTDIRIIKGREILQQAMTREGLGYLTEFPDAFLLIGMQAMGFKTLHSAFAAITDGHLEASTAIAEIFFGKKTGGNSPHKRLTTVRFTIHDLSQEALTKHFAFMEQKYGISLGSIRAFSPFGRREARIEFRLVLTDDAQRALQMELSSMGATDIMFTPQKSNLVNVLALSLIVILWGINPVIAKWFLLQGMAPLNLIVLRLLTFASFNIVFYLSWRIMSRHYSPVQRLTRQALLPALGLLGMTVFNYLALSTMPPSLHLTVLRFNVLLITFFAFFQKKTSLVRTSLLILGTIAAPLVLLLNTTNAPPWTGLAFSFAALLSYTMYSLSAERVMQQSGIHRRYPLLLLMLGIMLGIAGLVLLPLVRQTLLSPLSAWAILYVVVCVCVPHVFHHLLLQRMTFRQFTDLYLLEVPLAVLFEVALLGIVLHPAQYVLIVLMLAALVLGRWRALAAHTT